MVPRLCLYTHIELIAIRTYHPLPVICHFNAMWVGNFVVINVFDITIAMDKNSIKTTHIRRHTWVSTAQNRIYWRRAVHQGHTHIEEKVTQQYDNDRQLGFMCKQDGLQTREIATTLHYYARSFKLTITLQLSCCHWGHCSGPNRIYR